MDYLPEDDILGEMKNNNNNYIKDAAVLIINIKRSISKRLKRDRD